MHGGAMNFSLQQFMSKFYQGIIIILLCIILISWVFSGIQTWRVTSLKSSYQLLDTKYKTDVAEAKTLTEQAKAKARTQEKRWAEQLLKAEQNHNEKMQKIIRDSNRAKSAVNRLSKQLDTAKKRMSSASNETLIEYANTNADLLKECINQYQYVAEKADEHAASQRKLDEAWLMNQR